MHTRDLREWSGVFRQRLLENSVPVVNLFLEGYAIDMFQIRKIQSHFFLLTWVLTSFNLVILYFSPDLDSSTKRRQ